MDVSLRETRSPGRCWRRCARAGRGRVGAEPAGRAGEARGPPCGERPAVVPHSAAGRPLAPFPRRASLELWARCWRKAVLEAPWGAAGLLGSVHTPRAHDFHEGSPGRGACPAPGTGRWPGSPGAALLWWRLLREVTLASQLTRATLAFQSRGVPCLSCDTHQGRGKWMSLRCAYNCNIPLLSQITKQTRGEGDPWECGLGYGAPEEWRWGSMPMTAHRSQGSGCPGLRPLALLPTGWLPAAPGAHTGQSEGRGAGSQCRLSTVMKLRAPVCAEGPSKMGW